MKLLIKLLFFVVAQRLFLDLIFAQQHENGGRNGSYDNSPILNKSVGNSGNDLFGTQLLADSIQKSNVGKEVGENVVFTGSGDINLTVTNGLVFYVCSSCVGSVHICYQSRTTPTSNLNGNCLKSSQCFLQIEGEPTVAQTRGSVAFNPGSASYLKDGPTTCDKLKMSGAKTKFKNSGDIDTCDPNIENGVIQLSIKTARPGDAKTCEITAIGAKIKFSEIITTPKPQTSPTPPSSALSKSSDSTSESSIPVWAIIVIIVGLLLLLILVGLIVYCWWKQRESPKTPVSSAFEAPLAVVTRTDAKESTVSAQAPPPSKQDPKVAKPESTLSQELEKKPHVDKKKTSTKPEKKAVKEKTIEPTTTEELAPLEDAFNKNKLARVESAADSLEEAQKEWLKKKNEHRDQKRKKKSSKKRH